MKKILLAENDVFLINVYVNQLRKSGYSTSIASDGDIIINRIKSNTPDLLVLDASLPKIDGFSVLKKIREDAGLRELKVIMLLNFNQEQEINSGLNLGAIKCFSKAENTAEEIAEEIKTILS